MRIIFIFFWVVFVYPLRAQTQKISYNDEPLKFVLKDIESIYEIRFSYNEDLVKNIKVSLSSKVTLQQALNILNSETGLQFEFLDEDNIIVKKDSNAPSEVRLEETIIFAENLTYGFSQNKNNGAIKLEPDQLDILPGLVEPDVFQSLQLLPSITSPNESATDLHIRGGTPDQNLILWDGITVYHQGHLLGSITPVNPYVTDDVDIHIGGTSAQFGNRIAGVIDMHTMSDVPKALEVGVGANALQTDAFVKLPIIEDQLGIMVSGRVSLTNIFDSDTFNTITNKVFQNTRLEFLDASGNSESVPLLENKFTFSDYYAKLVYKPNKTHKLSLSGLLINNNLNYVIDEGENEIINDKSKFTNGGASLIWDYKINEKWNIQTNVHYSDYESEYILDESLEEEDVEPSVQLNTVKDFGVLTKASHKLSPKHTLLIGQEFTNFDIGVNVSISAVAPEVNNTQEFVQSVFVEDSYRHNNWYLRLGVRGNYFSNISEIRIEPRLYANYTLNDHWKIKASAEIKNQVISQIVSFNFFDLGLNNNVWVLADEANNVPLPNSRQVTAGALFTKQGWTLDVEGYYKYSSGLSSFSRGFNTATTLGELESITGKNTIHGFDVLLKKRIRRLRTWLGYAYSKSTFDFERLPLASRSSSFPGDFDQRHVLSWSNTYKYKKFQFALGWNFTTGRPYSVAIPFEFIDGEGNTQVIPDYETLNSERLDNYHRLDASIRYDFYLDTEKTINARLGVSVQNIFDRENEIGKSFREEDNQLFELTNLGTAFLYNVVFRVWF
ncbi:MAG: FecR domain-containing protein [Bacteroidota bacterium]